MARPLIPSEAVRTGIERLKRSIGNRLLGLDQPIEELLIALMAEGHILLEDVPGVGKTALAQAFSEALGLSFQRIQCTPDLLPSDIVGGLVFHPGKTEFIVRKGPIFANLLLVDEINRALPRTQSALLEAMAEGRVTIDRETHLLPRPFMVIATQNPVESQGVFPLPEAQLDRFLLKTSLGYPSAANDIAILSAYFQPHQEDPDRRKTAETPVATAETGKTGETRENGETAPAQPELPALLNAAVAGVKASPEILGYISDVVRATRNRPDVVVGASPRAMIMLAKAARARAVLAGRDFIAPDDVKQVAAGVLFHRLIMTGPSGHVNENPGVFMDNLLQNVEVPIEGSVV